MTVGQSFLFLEEFVTISLLFFHVFRSQNEQRLRIDKASSDSINTLTRSLCYALLSCYSLISYGL